ncbi:MAG: glycosyltransferase family 4 protein [Verrucomicrobiales bacterium]|nr:glycosyltransferase family 4 protein [Verrucomicrobiales bacterium]
MSDPAKRLEDVELILGNSNRRFSGVTSTMLQVLQHQQQFMKLAVLGEHHLPEGVPVVTFRGLIRLCRDPLPDGRPRIFHARRNNEMIQALLLKRIFGAKIKIVFTSTAQRYHSGFTRWLMGQMDEVISTCTAAASYLRTPPALLVPHGIDLATYFPSEDREADWNQLGLPGKKGIGIFGRVREQKGVDLLVRAALPLLNAHPDYTVVICGETTPDQKLFQEKLISETKAAGLEDRFAFLGKRPFEEIPLLFRSMTIVAALSRNEGFGLTVPEAMASGTAVLASEAGAWKDIVDDGIDGRIVPCDDLDATQKALGDMLESPDELETMGRKGRLKIEQHYTIEREAKALCDFFKATAAS